MLKNKFGNSFVKQSYESTYSSRYLVALSEDKKDDMNLVFTKLIYQNNRQDDPFVMGVFWATKFIYQDYINARGIIEDNRKNVVMYINHGIHESYGFAKNVNAE